MQVCDTLSTSFGLFLSKTWSRTAAGSLVRVRARQMECRKKTVLSKFAAGFRPGLQLARMMEYGLIALWLNTLESCFVLYVYSSGHRRLRMRIKTRLRQARGTCCITGGELGVDSSLLGQLNPVNVKCGEQVSQMGLGYANKCRFFPDFLHFVFESGMDARKEDDGL